MITNRPALIKILIVVCKMELDSFCKYSVIVQKFNIVYIVNVQYCFLLVNFGYPLRSFL